MSECETFDLIAVCVSFTICMLNGPRGSGERVKSAEFRRVECLLCTQTSAALKSGYQL